MSFNKHRLYVHDILGKQTVRSLTTTTTTTTTTITRMSTTTAVTKRRRFTNITNASLNNKCCLQQQQQQQQQPTQHLLRYSCNILTNNHPRHLRCYHTYHNEINTNNSHRNTFTTKTNYRNYHSSSGSGTSTPYDPNSSNTRSTVSLDVQQQQSPSQSQSIYKHLRKPTFDDIKVFQKILEKNRPGSIIVRKHLKPSRTSSTTKTIATTISDNIVDNDSGNDDDSILDIYNIDWTKHYTSTCNVLVRPETVQQIQEIIKYCSTNYIGIIPVGGRTGLVGGTIGYTNTEIFISVERLNIIFTKSSTSSNTNTPTTAASTFAVKCQAGCIVQTVQDYCSNNLNVLLPIDLGSKGTCQIGGIVSTNAGGSYYNKYGSISSNIIGIQVCLPNGTLYEYNYTTTTNTNTNTSNSTIVYKDNSIGYKLYQLFVGAEGTLGIITGIVMKCYPKPLVKHTMFVKCNSFTTIQHTVSIAQSVVGTILAACEYMDNTIMNEILLQNESSTQIKNPFFSYNHQEQQQQQQKKYYYLLIETHGFNEQYDREMIDKFLAIVMEQQQQEAGELVDGVIDIDNDNSNSIATSLTPIVIDGVLAQDMKQYNEFWKIRELCNPTVSSLGYTYKYDISIPFVIASSSSSLSSDCNRSTTTDVPINTINNDINFHTIVDIIDNRLNETIPNYQERKQSIKIYTWGHILDGNIHVNITTIGTFEIDPVLLNSIEPYLYEYIIKIGGSISAEHGLGQCKNQYLSSLIYPPNTNIDTTTTGTSSCICNSNTNKNDNTTLQLLQSIKTLFDPNHIMNPGKFLP